MADKPIPHQGLWDQLLKLEPQSTAKRAKCEYLPQTRRYVIVFLNTEYTVDLAKRRVCRCYAGTDAQDAGFLEQLCILAYLVGAKDQRLCDKLVRPEQLPAGQFFFRGHHSLPTAALAKVFGDCPQRLYEAAEAFGAERCGFGDASVRMYLLPRVPVTLVVWGTDTEFEARSSILFDQTAAEHMILDALLAATNLAVEAVVAACGRSGR